MNNLDQRRKSKHNLDSRRKSEQSGSAVEKWTQSGSEAEKWTQSGSATEERCCFHRSYVLISDWLVAQGIFFISSDLICSYFLFTFFVLLVDGSSSASSPAPFFVLNTKLLGPERVSNRVRRFFEIVKKFFGQHTCGEKVIPSTDPSLPERN